MLSSVIIPCFNAELYIEQTLKSVLSQTETDFEVIVIDDGSTDKSKEIILSFNDSRIKYFYQTNKGVSAARNNGLSKAKGKYVIFFDADDIMPKGFLQSRILLLEKNKEFDFVSGNIQKFNGEITYPEILRGISNNGINEILFYDKDVAGCPSNYLFRKDFLDKHKLLFNENISSPADKFFLLQCLKYGRTQTSPDVANLLYRVSENSMSGKLTKKLVLDNEMYFKELLEHNLIPSDIKRKVLRKGYYMLCLSFLKLTSFGKSVYYFIKYLSNV